MGKRNKRPAEARQMTTRQLTRFERERKLDRAIKIAAVAVFTTVVAILAFGFYREVLGRPGEAIARVNGRDILLGDYAKVLGYVETNVEIQKTRLQEMINKSPSNETEQDLTRQLAQQSLQQLEWNRILLPSQVLDEMIDDELVRQEALRRGLTVTSQEIDNDIVQQFSSRGTESSGATSATPENAASADQVNQTVDQPKEITITEATDRLSQALGQIGFLTVDEYRRFIVEPRIYTEKLQQAMADDVPRSAEQVHARHILVDSEEQAKDVLRMLNEEKLDFDAVAKQMSKDSATKEKGGDLGWFPRGIMTKSFEDAAFSLQPGVLSDPVVTEFGVHVIRVDERDTDRPLSEEHLGQLRNSALSKWLAEQKSQEASKVQRFDTVERTKWARDYVANVRKEMAKRAQLMK